MASNSSLSAGKWASLKHSRRRWDAGALAFARDLPRAEINLLDGGHFLLESKLGAVVSLMRPFLAEHLG